MITEYSQEFKESILQKIFFNPDQSVVSFAREANIPSSTVATWVRNYKKKNGKIMGQKKRKKLWSAEKMFETVLIAAPMSEAEKSVYPPDGRIRISAPLRMDFDTIRVFAISKLNWIKKQQAKLRNQERETPREFLNRESHYFNGKRYLLKVTERDAAPKVVLKHSTIELYVRPETDAVKRKSILNEWYRRKLKETVPSLIEKWEKKMNVQVNEFGIKRMKTKWGTCNLQAKRIWLNLDLAKKPAECLEYIVLHEMVHLLERNHSDRFASLMDDFMPKWRFYKDELNRLPVRHEDWNY